MKTFSSMFKVFCIIFLLSISGCGTKEEKNITTENKTETDNKNKTETNKESLSQPNNNAPDPEIVKIWSRIEKINDSMGKGINSGKSGHLEEPVEEIINLIKTIPQKSPNIEPADLDIIKVKVNELRKTGVIMDKYQHSDKSSELKEEYVKFNSALNDIKKVLPL